MLIFVGGRIMKKYKIKNLKLLKSTFGNFKKDIRNFSLSHIHEKYKIGNVDK